MVSNLAHYVKTTFFPSMFYIIFDIYFLFTYKNDTFDDCTKTSITIRYESESTTFTDIMGGSVYRSMMGENGFFNRTSNNLTGIFKTDGVFQNRYMTNILA